ncbi:MAG: non-canonical purine NTP pyrophosphatase [Planctomycetota bacterium]|nr:MAG: non-canonical purine NTP pyrophosphatase [Planctomycetota bacterium]
MRQRLLVASHNLRKLEELRRLCAELPLEVLGPESLPEGLPEVEETGVNFLQNAGLKAFSAAAAAASQLGPDAWALADDSGLEVDALDGEPGVRSARYAGADGSREQRDAANIARLLARLRDVPPEARTARFICVIAVARRDEILFAVEGRVEGRILPEPEGSGGFGYDPVFYHEASGRSFASLSAQEKAAVSHRGLAVARLRRVLESVLPAGTH